MGTAAIYNADRRSRTVYLSESVTPQSEQPQPGNYTNYVPVVKINYIPWS